MAILLEEEGIYERCRIYATDLSEAAVTQARKGSFPLSSSDEYAGNYVRAGGKKSLSDYFRTKGDRLLIDSSLKKHMVFSEHNLATDGSFNEFQVIVCRDVLASFNDTLRARVAGLIYDSLSRLGVLALGADESLESTPHEARYAVLDGQRRLYQKL
jgi:chemotaxis protein methyltransferase CheR